MIYSFREWTEAAIANSKSMGYYSYTGYSNVPGYIKWPLLFPCYLFQKYIVKVVIETEGENHGTDKKD